MVKQNACVYSFRKDWKTGMVYDRKTGMVYPYKHIAETSIIYVYMQGIYKFSHIPDCK